MFHNYFRSHSRKILTLLYDLVRSAQREKQNNPPLPQAMNKTNILAAIKSIPNGQFATLVVDRPLNYLKKALKDNPALPQLYKRTSYTVQNNVDYGSRKAVLESIARGEREAPSDPSWKGTKFEDGVKLKFHKGNGQEYIPCDLISINKVEYRTEDGQEVNVAAIKLMPLMSSDKPKTFDRKAMQDKGQDAHITPKLESIFTIGKPFAAACKVSAAVKGKQLAAV